MLRLTNDDVIPFVTKSSVVHISVTVFFFSPSSTYLQFFSSLFDIITSILFTIGGTTITISTSVAMILFSPFNLIVYEHFALVISCALF